mgnify:CR=1 FL=1
MLKPVHRVSSLYLYIYKLGYTILKLNVHS